jgi:hypothetical protein
VAGRGAAGLLGGGSAAGGSRTSQPGPSHPPSVPVSASPPTSPPTSPPMILHGSRPAGAASDAAIKRGALWAVQRLHGLGVAPSFLPQPSPHPHLHHHSRAYAGHAARLPQAQTGRGATDSATNAKMSDRASSGHGAAGNRPWWSTLDAAPPPPAQLSILASGQHSGVPRSDHHHHQQQVVAQAAPRVVRPILDEEVVEDMFMQAEVAAARAGGQQGCQQPSGPTWRLPAAARAGGLPAGVNSLRAYVRAAPRGVQALSTGAAACAREAAAKRECMQLRPARTPCCMPLVGPIACMQTSTRLPTRSIIMLGSQSVCMQPHHRTIRPLLVDPTMMLASLAPGHTYVYCMIRN